MKKLISMTMALVMVMSFSACGSSGSSSTDPFAMLTPGLTRNDIHTAYGKPAPANASYNNDTYEVEFLGETVDLDLYYSDNRQVYEADFSYYQSSNSMSAFTFAEKVNTYYTKQYGDPLLLGLSADVMFLEWEREDGATITMSIPSEDDTFFHVMFEFN